MQGIAECVGQTCVRLPWAVQVPAAELPEYREREHLKGADAALVERVRAEIAHVHGAALAGLGLEPKVIVTEGRRGCAHAPAPCISCHPTQGNACQALLAPEADRSSARVRQQKGRWMLPRRACCCC